MRKDEYQRFVGYTLDPNQIVWQVSSLHTIDMRWDKIHLERYKLRTLVFRLSFTLT